MGTTFTAGPDVAFELTEVGEPPPQPGAPREAPFVLGFRGPAGLEQRTYELDHEALGRLDVFLVPIAAERYEAVFN